MLLTAFILFIWFESDILLTLIKVSKLDKKFHVTEYERQRLELCDQLSFIDFLSIKNPNFFTKLISCPICLCFWLVLIQYLFYQYILFISYSFVFNYFINLIVYLIVKKLYDNR